MLLACTTLDGKKLAYFVKLLKVSNLTNKEFKKKDFSGKLQLRSFRELRELHETV